MTIPNSPGVTAKTKISPADWRDLVREHQKPSRGRATWQLVNTLGSFTVLWYLMYLSLAVSWWLVLRLAVLAGLVLVRVFIIFHDCGHGSFFRSRRANDVVGFITGVLTLTPYQHWRQRHAIHHATSGHLDKRGTGDIWTMTVEEYFQASRWKRFAYQLARNPFILFGIAPLYLLVVHQRFPIDCATRRERASVHWMNVAVAGVSVALAWIFGFVPYLIIHLTVILVTGAVGVWMFYVQHQFEDVYWERGADWDYTAAALEGSSFYKLPRIFQWFTGNIGFHHIHHLSPRIPNYNLERCHKAHELFQQVKPLTFFASLRAMNFRFWDEQQKKLVGYLHIRNLRRQQRQAARSTEGAAG